MLKKGFTILEIILVLSVISLFAGVAAPSFFKQQAMNHIDLEVKNGDGIRQSLETYIRMNRIIPGSTATASTVSWGTAAGKIANIPASKITTNAEGFNRIYIYPDNFIATADTLPYNQANRATAQTLPLVAPTNAKFMIITSTKKNLATASGVMAAATFDNIWNQTGTFPAELTEVAKGPLIIERGNVSNMFSSIVLNNNSNGQPVYSVDGNPAAGKIMAVGPSTENIYLLKGSLVSLMDTTPTLLNKYAVRDNVSYSFAGGSWGGVVSSTGSAGGAGAGAGGGAVGTAFNQNQNGQLTNWAPSPTCSPTGTTYQLTVTDNNQNEDFLVYAGINGTATYMGKVKSGQSKNYNVSECEMIAIVPKGNNSTQIFLYYMPHNNYTHVIP